jgi:hypothetical protein
MGLEEVKPKTNELAKASSNLTERSTEAYEADSILYFL